MVVLVLSSADLGPAFVSSSIQEVYMSIPGNNQLAPRKGLLAGYIAERRVDGVVRYAADQSDLLDISRLYIWLVEQEYIPRI